MAKKKGLYANINARKKKGISRSKKKSTISPKAYANMKAGFPKSKKKKRAWWQRREKERRVLKLPPVAKKLATAKRALGLERKAAQSSAVIAQDLPGNSNAFRKPLRILTRRCGFLENAGSVKQRARLDCQKHFLLHRRILSDPTSGRKYLKSLMLSHDQGAFVL